MTLLTEYRTSDTVLFMKRALLLPALLITACTTNRSDDHSYVNIYQHNVDKNQTELAIQSMQKRSYRRSQVRTEEQESYSQPSYQQLNENDKSSFNCNKYFNSDQEYLYLNKSTTLTESNYDGVLIMDDDLGQAYSNYTGKPYISTSRINMSNIPKPPLFAVSNSNKRVYIEPSEIRKMLDSYKSSKF
jgi:hypothetical protein